MDLKRRETGMEIRKAAKDDRNRILELYTMARAFMRENGNPDQWGYSYPPEELVLQDITEGKSYVCVEEETVLAVFFYEQGIEPDYLEIYDGEWLNEEAYSVVHRIAAPTGRKGVASFCIRWCCENSPGNVRIDTHRDNIPMQNMLQKNGFVRCGIIYIKDGSERIAYQWKK